MSKVIIGIHGLGNKPSREVLQGWWLESMKEGLNGIGSLKKMPPFELIYWADVINYKPLDPAITDIEDLYYIDEKYEPAPLDYRPEANPVRKKIMEFIEQHMDKVLLNDDLTLRFPFISDLIINRYFYELGLYFNNKGVEKAGITYEIKNLLRRRVSDVLRKYKNHEIFLVAHSMGSIIAYDVLSLISPDLKISTFVTIGSPLGLPVILSKIAKSDEYQPFGYAKPRTPPGIKDHWYNFSDPDDRIALDHTLNDDYDANENGVRATDISVFNNYVVNGLRNPHKSFGYLRSGEFAQALYDFIRKKEKPLKKRIAQKIKIAWKRLVTTGSHR